MKNKSIKLIVVFEILSLILATFSATMFLLHGQKQTHPKSHFIAPIASDSNDFISIWETTNEGYSDNNQIHLPLVSSGNYNFIVNWGDGNSDTITIWDQAAVTHTYTSTGLYTITITGLIEGWQFNDGGDKLKILEIQQWGSLRLINSGNYFRGCSNLELTATDDLNLTGITKFR